MPPTTRVFCRTFSLALLSVCGLASCQGEVGSPSGPFARGGQGAYGSTSSSGVVSGQGSGDFATGRFDALQCADRVPAPGAMPGLVRLTHRQYDNAVKDLLGVDANAVVDFLGDQQFYGFDNNAANLAVAENQVLRYQATAERIAQAVAADMTGLKRSVPCVAPAADSTCRDLFVAGFLKLLWRRPVSDDERSRYTAVFDAGAGLYADGDVFSRGVRVVLEAALQSPAFLYRAELRSTPLDGSVVALDAYELASRLSLTLWASVPDAALMAKADAGELSTDAQVEGEVRRMLGDAKAARVLDDFHSQWLELNKLRFDKDAATFPGYDKTAFEASAREEALSFARYVSQEDTSFTRLFTAPMTFVDKNLASIYGVSPPSSGFARVDLDPNERAGLFTQLGFLAGHADALDSSPIHRGAYIQKRVLCTVFGPLPVNVGSLPARTADIVTTRDQVEAKTAPPQCQGCHVMINPAGFAFEAFDTLGRHRTIDHGENVDASGTIALDGKDVDFNGAVEFAQALGGSDGARRCYETQWFRYGLGRGEADDDVCLLSEIDARAQQAGGSVTDMLVALTLSRGFRFRSQEDL